MRLDPAWKSTKWETEATTIKLQSPCFPHYVIVPSLLLLLLLLSLFSRVWLCATPLTVAHQAPPSGILQARTLEWVAISFSNAWKWKVKGKSLSHVRLFTTLWTAAHQAPPPMGFSRQEYWSGLPLPSPLPSKSPITTTVIRITNAKHNSRSSSTVPDLEEFLSSGIK